MSGGLGTCTSCAAQVPYDGSKLQSHLPGGAEWRPVTLKHTIADRCPGSSRASVETQHLPQPHLTRSQRRAHWRLRLQ